MLHLLLVLYELADNVIAFILIHLGLDHFVHYKFLLLLLQLLFRYAQSLDGHGGAFRLRQRYLIAFRVIKSFIITIDKVI